MIKYLEKYNRYVTDDGKVFRRNKNGELIECPQSNIRKGYKVVSITPIGNKTTMTVHRLVAEAFIPNPENKPTVDHIDRNPANNNVNNLRWATYRENTRNRSNSIPAELAYNGDPKDRAAYHHYRYVTDASYRDKRKEASKRRRETHKK